MSDLEKLNDEALLNVAGGTESDLAIAYQVINGDWGNGDERIARLAAAGYDPYTIQRIVNAILAQSSHHPQPPRPPRPPYHRDPYLG